MTKLLIDFRRPKRQKKEKEKGKNPVIIHYIISSRVRTKCDLSTEKKKNEKNVSPRGLKGPRDGLMNRPRGKARKKSQDIYIYILSDTHITHTCVLGFCV